MNSISALITVISIVFLSILEINGCTKPKTITDNQSEKSLLNNMDSLITIQYKEHSVDSLAIEPKEQSFRKL